LTKPVRQATLYDSIMTVLRPVADTTPAATVSHAHPATVPAITPLRVLLAEDNVVNQKLAVRLLERHGCRVDTVANGREAVETLRRITYDLVFMDCQMPVMDGYTATAAIRAFEARSGTHMPIIAMTANAMPGDRERCLDAGMDDYVTKPLKDEVLLEVVQRWGLPVVHDVRPAIDAHIFSGLTALCDGADTAFLSTLINDFLQDALVRLATLQRAINTGDATTLEGTAHTLKSSSSYMGAVGMATLCEQLQMLGKTGAVYAAVPLVEQLGTEVERVRQALEAQGATLSRQ
jgi:two-component system sensor histidine kinase/response regulator